MSVLLFLALLWLLVAIWKAPAVDDQTPTHPPFASSQRAVQGSSLSSIAGALTNVPALFREHWRGIVFALVFVPAVLAFMVLVGAR